MDRSLGSSGLRRLLVVAGFAVASVSIAPLQAQNLCGGTTYPFPYTDVSGVGAAFCPGIMEAYVTGVSKGTSPTTFSPNENVSRLQMTTFLQRSVNLGLTRTSWRAAAEQWWLPQNSTGLLIAYPGAAPVLCKPDRDSIWVAAGDTVVRFDANTGATLATFTGAVNAYGVLVVGQLVYVTGNTSPGAVYFINTQSSGGAVGKLGTPGIGAFPKGIAFDGANIWTANGDGSVSIIPPSHVVQTVTGFIQPFGMVFDGTNMWTTDLGANFLDQLDASGNILQRISTGAGPAFPVFDGANIWVPNSNDSTVTVVQASTGAIVASIGSGFGLDQPATAAFDGVRILITNQNSATATLFKAADLSLIGNVSLPGATPYGACSDGLNFWVTLNGAGALARF
jgi:hypothetical protein